MKECSMSIVTAKPPERVALAVCSTPDCGYPVENVEFWTERARARIPKYWLDRFVDDGNPASPEGLCTDCGAEWLIELEDYRDEHRCDGSCSPYDNCMCELMLTAEEY
jgi:hypothetical protein